MSSIDFGIDEGSPVIIDWTNIKAWRLWDGRWETYMVSYAMNDSRSVSREEFEQAVKVLAHKDTPLYPTDLEAKP